jgi:serine/threonine protein kinase
MKNLIGASLGQFEIKEKIGQGGMAHVFKAYQASLDRYVAIKVLSPALAEEPGFTERFQREAHSVARLTHPNILPVFDFGVQDKYNYIVMRYVEDSRTLHHLIEEGAPLDELIGYIVQVADALNYAHKRNIIHRDVKPSNILIGDKWALLSDFGLVKMVGTGSHLTGTGVGLGTPAYMSPEQAAGSKVDHRTDIYALGIILHKILTGTIPHDAPTPLAILIKRTTEPVTPPRRIKPDIPESLEDVVLHSLATKPDARFSTATDFAEALKQAKADPTFRSLVLPEPVDVTVASLNGKTMVPVRPGLSRLTIAALAAVLFFIISGAGLMFFMAGNSNLSAQTNRQTPTSESAALKVTLLVATTAAPPTHTATPVPAGTPAAQAKTKLEVRRGPGNNYELLGYLPQGAMAQIVSRDEAAGWWQIKTTLAAAGLGWITAGPDFVEATNAANVPIGLAPPLATPTPLPDTPITAPLSTATPTPTATSSRPASTPTTAAVALPTRTPTVSVPSGQFVLLAPASTQDATYGPTEFTWQWGSPLAENQGFEVRVWREGEAPAGVHDSVLDNREGRVKALGNNTYQLVADITQAPGVNNRGGEYYWTVVLVQIKPGYRDLGVQATPPGRLRFAPPGGKDGGGGGGGGGGQPTD